jgi:ABC-2 type transport system permease protein
MKRLALTLAAYTRRCWLQWLAGRSFVFTLAVNQGVTPLIGLAVWAAALPGQPGLKTYYVALLAVQLCTASYEDHTFSERLYQGHLADDLLRPHPVVLAALGENIALRGWHLLIGLPLILAAGFVAGTHFAWSDLALALPALLLAAILRFLFTFLLALSAFWTQQAHGLTSLGETLLFLLGGTAVPLALLPGPLHALGSAFPFPAMLGFPAEIAVGQLSPADILGGYGWQIIWIVAFAALALAFWRAGLRRYTAVGG